MYEIGHTGSIQAYFQENGKSPLYDIIARGFHAPLRALGRAMLKTLVPLSEWLAKSLKPLPS
jgi:hypothetical protein